MPQLAFSVLLLFRSAIKHLGFALIDTPEGKRDAVLDHLAK